MDLEDQTALRQSGAKLMAKVNTNYIGDWTNEGSLFLTQHSRLARVRVFSTLYLGHHFLPKVSTVPY